MPRGGARAGAGRPRTRSEEPEADSTATGKPVKPAANVIPAQASAADFLLAVMNDTTQPLSERLRCALAVHAKEVPGLRKPEEPGKKEQAQSRANEVAAGASPYRPRTPPKLVRAS